MQNPIFGPDNSFFVTNAPKELKQARQTLDGLPLGVTASGELGLKVIVIGNASVGLADLPTQPGASGTIYNNNGKPVVSP